MARVVTRRKKRVAAVVRGEAEDGARIRILDAALAVFAQRGFDGARTREIADRAGANLGLITYYFRDKDRLWRAAVTRAFTRLQGELAEVLTPRPDDDERIELERLVRRFVGFVARNPQFMQLMNDEGKRDSPRMRWLADTFVRPMFEALRTRVEHAQANGLLPPIPAANLHYLVLGAAGLAFSQAAECQRVTGVDPTSDAFAEAHVDALLRLLGTRTA